MKISLITVTFNSASTVRTTLQSVANQTWNDIEHIIVDGNSVDGTLEIVKDFKHVNKIISENDKGIYDAMNKGIMNASGNIIGFLNSDDWFYSDFILEEIASEFISHKLDAVYGDLEFVKDEKDKKPRRKWISEKYRKDIFLKGWIPPHPTFYAKLDLYKKYGFFNSKLRFAADFDIMCRFISKENVKIKYLPGIKVKMRLGGATTKNLKNIVLGNIEIYNSLKRNNIQAGPFFIFKKIFTKLKQYKKH